MTDDDRPQPQVKATMRTGTRPSGRSANTTPARDACTRDLRARRACRLRLRRAGPGRAQPPAEATTLSVSDTRAMPGRYDMATLIDSRDAAALRCLILVEGVGDDRTA